jgi:hypothetical protein
MWYIIRISFERVLRNIQKISFKDLGTISDGRYQDF